MSPLQSLEAEIRQHAKALRLLARDLVGDTHADDLVQETALRALRSPPPRPSGLGAWLATILRRLAHNHRRDEQRRQRRESLPVAEDVAPPADAALLHRESLRAVTTALFALPDPYQSALLLRYFEGLSPSRIAARTGTPLATVKSRLQRGLLLLRERLDHDDPRRRWRAALMLATGAALPLPFAVLTTGSALMTKVGKFVVVAAALFGGAALLWQAGGVEAPPLPSTDGGGGQPVAANAVIGAGEQPATERRATESAAAATLDLDHPYVYELQCHIVDRDGLPIEGAGVAFAPAGCALNTWNERSASDGGMTLRWRARESTTALALGVLGRSSVPALHHIDLAAGTTTRVVLLGEAQAQVQAYGIRTRKRAPAVLAATLDEPACAAGQQGDCRICHAQNFALRGLRHEELLVREALHPFATFADLLLPTDLTATRKYTETLRSFQEAEHALVAKRRAVGERIDVVATKSRGGAAAGFVFGEDGKPAANATVAICGSGGAPIARGRTDKTGAYRLESLAAGRHRLRAGGGDAGLGYGDVDVVVGETATANVQLQRGATIRGQALGTDRKPLADALVEFEAHGEPWRDAAVVDKEGRFVLPNLPSGGGRLLLLPRQGTLPIAVVNGALPDAGEVRFDLGASAPAAGQVLLRVTAAEDLGKLGCEVRVWQVDTARGASMQQRKDGAFVLDGLAAGFYRIEFGADSLGWTQLGQHWVDGKGLTDLGTTRLAQPGTLVLNDVPADCTFELYQRRDHGDIRVEVGLGSRREVRLPAGDWLLLWRGQDQVLRAREVTLVSGGTSRVALAPGTEPRAVR